MKRREGGIWGEKPLSSAVGNLLKGAMEKSDRQLVTLITEWPLIVGEDMARYSHPHSLKRNRNEAVLKLGVESGYATFVQHELPTIKERIAQFIGAGAVTRIMLEPLAVPTAIHQPAKKTRGKKQSAKPDAVTGNPALDDALAALMEALNNRH